MASSDSTLVLSTKETGLMTRCTVRASSDGLKETSTGADTEKDYETASG